MVFEWDRRNSVDDHIDFESEDIRSHYDFSKGVQGKWQHLIGQPYTIKIHQPDGKSHVYHVDAPIELDEDVRAYFPTSEAVNAALRGLIELIPKHHPIFKTPESVAD